MMDDIMHLSTRRAQKRGLLKAVPSTFAIYVLVLSLALFRAAEAGNRESIHTVVTTECTPYFDWQVLGLWYR